MLALIERTATGYRATTGKPLEAQAEGATREAALNELRLIVTARLSADAELVELTIPGPHPLAEFAGDLKDNPLFDEWVDEMKTYRQQRDAERS